MTALSSPLARTRATRLLVVVLGLLLAAAALISPGASAQGSPALAPTASIVVNDAGDTTGACATTGTGACTLRDAITYANSNAGADTITFNIPFLGGCTGVNQCTITLGSALPDITDDVTIDGAPNSARITINGNSNRILQVNNNGSTTFGALTVNALTLENGSYFLGGGAIGNRGGTVNVTNSTFFNNSVIANSAGGAIYNLIGTVNVTNSTFTDNSATGSGNGGAIWNQATLNVTSSTFSGNSAGGSGGGIYNFGPGTTTLRNTIIANSTSGGDCRNNGGTINAEYSLIEDGLTCVNGTNSNNLTGDPNLGPLADNGGPTQTHALLTGSPAIDAGDTALATDQRGEPRPIGSADDIGAYERQFCEQDAWLVSDETELNEAIACYNAKPVAGTYPITATQNISLTASTTQINNATAGVSLVIEGGGFAVDGQGTAGVRPFDIAANTTVTMNDLTITGGRASSRGGGILNVGTLRVNNSLITGNESTAGGGGIANGINNSSGSTLVVNNSTISNNTAREDGGGVSNWPGSGTTIRNSTISGNTANIGGGIENFSFNSPASVWVSNSTISGNTASNRGGGIHGSYNFGGGHIEIDSSTITNNRANNGGSGLYSFQNATITVKNSIIALQQAGGADCEVQTGTPITSNGHNISSDATCGFTSTGDQQNVSAAALNLGPLADNGGPTETHALLPGSAALNAGDTTLTTDQRGVGRPQGAADDIGAFEAELGTITVVKVTQPANNTSFDFADNIVAPNAFTLSDGQQKDFLIVPTGVYTVTEASNTGSFQLRNLVCVDGDPNGQPSTGDVGTRTATINLDSGETVTCTFTNSNRPLAVTLASFEAVAQTDHVLVTWETVSELENAGFNLYRTATADPPSAADLQAYVPSQGPGSVLGYLYSHQDYDVTAGQTYWYWLEDVDLNGITTMHGPVSVVFVGPTAVTLSGLAASAGDPAPLAWPWFVAALAALLAMAVARRRSMNS